MTPDTDTPTTTGMVMALPITDTTPVAAAVPPAAAAPVAAAPVAVAPVAADAVAPDPAYPEKFAHT